MDAVIELKGFTLIVTDESLSVEGPELVTRYVQARDQLIGDLDRQP